MMDIDGLVERLNRRSPFVNDPISLKPRLRNPDGPEAATELARLKGEVEVLRAGIEARDTFIRIAGQWGTFTAQHDARSALTGAG